MTTTAAALAVAGRLILATLRNSDGDGLPLKLIVDEIEATPDGLLDTVTALASICATVAVAAYPDDPERFVSTFIQSALNEPR
ncbi:hypothetical protein [Antrihabitans spumae]|uniref:Uncharacterized protein n=1 Tax=Antrihabitans spumae TaxID=3373370 RepID=A0ABW7KR72_9NOCA